MITVRFKFFHSLRFCFPMSSKNGLNHIKFISSCSKEGHMYQGNRCKQGIINPDKLDERSYSTGQTRLKQKNEMVDFSVINEGKKLKIAWSDGKTSNFHAVWLRFNCYCEECCDPSSNMKSLTLHEMPLTSTIKSVQQKDDGTLVVQFVEENHISSFGGDWLKQNCYSKESLKEMRESLKPVFYSDKYLPELSYSDVKKSDEALYRWLKNINEYGLCLLKDVPTEKDMLKTVIRHIGPVEQSIYGETYELYVREVPINLAYSSKALQFHTDLPMYECPPGIQFLHCLKFDDTVKGGETTFADLIHIAEEFRIINIKWSPPYHGPIALEEDLIEPFYRAFILFGKAIENYKYKRAIRLVNGDVIAFNNRRVCHGRNSFENMHGERHLQGGYVNIDDYKSKLMILHKKYGDGSPIRRVFNTDWS
ncbi:hypothetical protein KUTeg_006668 [Tegillarca granosa]|uniref:Gamma-butyrobetaine dioxygenase n=1 Tax=Tegillarca granosa TaxID=220873 RepID=A0ABQ9FFR8_TEGGR|nr:hypothetical protein KUTeg_006668 [Tegillarca granosa]